MKIWFGKMALGGVAIVPCLSHRLTPGLLEGRLLDCIFVSMSFQPHVIVQVMFAFQVALLLDMVRREPANRLIPTLVYSVPRIALQLVAEARMFLLRLESMHDKTITR